jgi:hypothetical protein
MQAVVSKPAPATGWIMPSAVSKPAPASAVSKPKAAATGWIIPPVMSETETPWTISLPCASCTQCNAIVNYTKHQLQVECTSCCGAVICNKCFKRTDPICCVFCKKTNGVKPNVYYKGNQWQIKYASLLQMSDALAKMPQFFTFLRRSFFGQLDCNDWNDVKVQMVHEMYLSFMDKMNQRMCLHLWGRFSRNYLPQIQVIGGTVPKFNFETMNFVRINQDQLYSWKPTKRQVSQFRFGLILKIAMKMATGPFKATLIDGCIQPVYEIHQDILRMLLRRKLKRM